MTAATETCFHDSPLLRPLISPVVALLHEQLPFVHSLNVPISPLYKIQHCYLTSGVTIGRARRAVHAGPALWGAQNLPDAVFF